jgi:hypothetical protein
MWSIAISVTAQNREEHRSSPKTGERDNEYLAPRFTIGKVFESNGLPQG